MAIFWKKEGEKRPSLETFYSILMGKYVLIFDVAINTRQLLAHNLVNTMLGTDTLNSWDLKGFKASFS